MPSSDEGGAIYRARLFQDGDWGAKLGVAWSAIPMRCEGCRMGSPRELKLVVQRAGLALGGASREEARMLLPDPPDEDKVCERGGQSPGTTSRRRRA
jgi:hypothetical protein